MEYLDYEINQKKHFRLSRQNVTGHVREGVETAEKTTWVVILNEVKNLVILEKTKILRFTQNDKGTLSAASNNPLSHFRKVTR